ncbi:hypothetical protein [Nitrosomonas ureae]|uniref:Uncharacterized protein n=1 Tax=Nitrosomonas ureae TaxID=44577 RepID=A0A1H5WBV5_9PROT|nr:hypothetical protein [Nitrosomonas ureae]SEF96952.1 hypothetical protein SAMN05216334_11762 [Nitrosomonas ureae]
MNIIDNINAFLGDDLKEFVRPNAKLKIAASCFSIYAYEALNYTMSPCHLYRDSIHCEDLVCVKGDEEKTMRLRQNLDEARDLLRKAEDAVSDGYAGGDRWLEHHLSAVERLSQLCSIIDDPNIRSGRSTGTAT